MSAFDLHADVAASLDRLVPAEVIVGDWVDVIARARPTQRRRPRGWRIVVVAALFLIFAGIATATYELAKGLWTARPAKATLTLINDDGHAFANILAVDTSGRTRTVWTCPRRRFCGDPTSLDWSADGRWLSFTLTEIGGRSAYVGLHIVNVRSGRDLQIPHIRLAHPHAVSQPSSVLHALADLEKARLGCDIPPGDVAWAPNGLRLAYDCRDYSPGALDEIFTIGRDGSGVRRLNTGTRNAVQPSWSPNGRQIAFSTWTSPVETIRIDTKKPAYVVHSSLYVINADGTGRRLLARDAASPSWSPDGRAIAYNSPAGIRLIKPNRRPVNGPPIAGPPGVPRWSPDGRQLAVGTGMGILVVDPATGASKLVTKAQGAGILGRGRPAWYPGSPPPRLRSQQNATPVCVAC
jgi:Tol biopolymer transport system component